MESWKNRMVEVVQGIFFVFLFAIMSVVISGLIYLLIKEFSNNPHTNLSEKINIAARGLATSMADTVFVSPNDVIALEDDKGNTHFFSLFYLGEAED